MTKYRVYVWLEQTTNGFIEVEAKDEFDARQQVFDMDTDDIEYLAEWGSCGDEKSIEVSEEVEEIYVPSVSDVLWENLK